MKRNVFRFGAVIALAVSGLLFGGCRFGLYPACFGEDGPEKRMSDNTELSGSDLPENGVLPGTFSAVAFSDTHFGSPKEYGNTEKFLTYLESAFNDADETKRPRFLVCLGDIADTGMAEQYDMYNEFVDKVKELAKNSALADNNFKVYGMVGNHDLYNWGWNNWRECVYPYKSCYHFSVGGYSFYFEDTANSALGNKQYSDLSKAMTADTNPKVVFSHYPMYENGTLIFKMQDSYERSKLVNLYASNKVLHVFGGHAHKDVMNDFGSFSEQLIGSMRYTGTVVHFTVGDSSFSQEIIDLSKF